jgi:hypothetical protein
MGWDLELLVKNTKNTVLKIDLRRSIESIRH